MIKSLAFLLLVVFLARHARAAAITPGKARTLALPCNFLNCMEWNKKCRYECAVHIMPDCEMSTCNRWLRICSRICVGTIQQLPLDAGDSS
ncbi:BQ5605_C014g07620 [Microbotryum silenes-dioicae]|uniref:BQ5605_C014g07620 protein n=1 Tax=Microbotryum silenes-dioicae TaxID=796604 RepID=A0A2X0NXK1_9BASI|nr:BQ5605_C014g07620 [Microbotryum silenes-dioicae]